MAIEYVIGIDGGGSRIRSVIVDTGGRLTAHIGLPFSANVVSVNALLISERLRALFDAYKTYIPDRGTFSGIIAAGFAGAGRESERQATYDIFSNLGFKNRVFIFTDLEIALEGAFPFGFGIVLAAGTGSAAFGKDSHGIVRRCGGWGYLLSDEGSGYDIGRKAIAYSLRSFDGLLPKTRLLDDVCSHFSLSSITEIVTLVHSGKIQPAEIADCAPIVFKAAYENDAVAASIITEAGTALGTLVFGLLQNLHFTGRPVPLCLTGSLFKSKEMLLPHILASLPEGSIAITEPVFPPVIGAVLKAFHTAGISVTGDITNNLKQIHLSEYTLDTSNL